MEKQRVQKFIALSGLCSRRKAEELIEKGRVKVNGKEISLGDHALPTDEIKVDNKKISFDLNDKIYILMNKPEGYVCTKSDEMGRKTVFDLIEEDTNNLFTVGRLDKDTTGLLIITNDGEFAQKIIHPSSKIKKEYIVYLDKKLEEKDRKAIEKGVQLEDVKLMSCVIKDFKDKYLVKIWEGRKRQIRRMFEVKDYKVTMLERIGIGNLQLKKTGVKHGKYKKVKREFLEKNIF